MHDYRTGQRLTHEVEQELVGVITHRGYVRCSACIARELKIDEVSSAVRRERAYTSLGDNPACDVCRADLRDAAPIHGVDYVLIVARDIQVTRECHARVR